MKLKTLFSLAIGLGLVVAARNAVADVNIPLSLTLSLSVLQQGQINDDGTNTTATSKIQKYATINLLNLIAQDELAEGNWNATNFPTGSKLMVSDTGFSVWSSANQVLITNIDFLSFEEVESGIKVYSGKQNDSTQLPNPSVTKTHIGRITFDDSGIPGGGNLQFFLQGVLAETTTAKATTGGTLVTRTVKITGATGPGVDSGSHDLILTATLSGTGSVTVP